MSFKSNLNLVLNATGSIAKTASKVIELPGRLVDPIGDVMVNSVTYVNNETEFYLATQNLTNTRSLKELQQEFRDDEILDKELLEDSKFQVELKELRKAEKMQAKRDRIS